MSHGFTQKVSEYKVLSPTKPAKTDCLYSTPSKDNLTSKIFVKGIAESNTSTPNKLNSSTDSKFESFESSKNLSNFDTNTEHLDHTVKQKAKMSDEAVATLQSKLAELTATVRALQTPAPLPTTPICKFFDADEDLKRWKDTIGFFPSEFCGKSSQSTKDHLERFDKWCMFSNTTNIALRVKWFGLSLSGSASSWFKHTEFFSFDDLKEKFEQNFGQYRTKAEARTAFNNISYSHGERAADYFKRIRDLAIIAGMSEADMADQFYRGLGNGFIKVKQIRCLYSIEQAITYMQSILETKQSMPEVSFAASANNVSRSSRSRSKSKSKGKHHSSRSRSSSNRSRRSSNSSSRSRSRSSSTKRSQTPHREQCFNCQGYGHMSNDCPSPKNSGKNRSSNNRSSSRKSNSSSSRGNKHYYAIQSEEVSDNRESSDNHKPLSDSRTYKRMTDSNGKEVFVVINDRDVDLN